MKLHNVFLMFMDAIIMCITVFGIISMGIIMILYIPQVLNTEWFIVQYIIFCITFSVMVLSVLVLHYLYNNKIFRRFLK